MSEPYLGEIKLFSFNFPPKGYAACNGQLLPINQNQALFSLLGTYYGGNGQTTFALPNLQGRTPLGFSGTYGQGGSLGEDAHTLTAGEMPAHTHSLKGTSVTGDTRVAQGHSLAASSAGAIDYYGGGKLSVALAPQSVGNAGGARPHENRQPFLVLNFCIALVGIFPSRN